MIVATIGHKKNTWQYKTAVASTYDELLDMIKDIVTLPDVKAVNIKKIGVSDSDGSL